MHYVKIDILQYLHQYLIFRCEIRIKYKIQQNPQGNTYIFPLYS